MEDVARYSSQAPAREEVDAWPGLTLLQFGANWCGHCQAAVPAIAEALVKAPPLRRLLIEDGPGRPLGRSFRVKLWPTLILLRDGQEVDRLIRPTETGQVVSLLAQA